MDYGNDTQNSLEVAKFVEAQSVRTNPFGDNRVGERAYRRSERIAAALVLLTNHVPEREPLRAAVRSKAADLPSHVLALRDEMRSVNSERVRALKSSIRELISLARLLAVSGFVSFQNAATVSEALDELSGFLVASQRSNLSESASFSREDFLDARDSAPMPVYRDRKVSKSIVKDIEHVTDNKEHAHSSSVQGTDAPNKGQTKHPVRNARTRAITEVLRASGELGIRDISSNLPEYSEKMIQRELAQMAASGQVKKAGSKRWSVYTLAS